MSLYKTLLNRSQWHTMDMAAQLLSIELGEAVSVEQVAECAKSGDFPIFVDISMPAWPLVDEGVLADFYCIFPAQQHPVPPSPILGLKVNTYDTDCTLSGKYQLPQSVAFSEVSEWYVKDLDSGEIFIPAHQYRLLPSGKSFPERPARPAPEEWLFKKEDLESFISELHTEAQEGEHMKCSSDEVKALEVLGLMAETFASRSQKYGNAKKPNVSQIAEAMFAQSGQAKGMGERKLKEYISDGLDAWEEWKQ